MSIPDWLLPDILYIAARFCFIAELGYPEPEWQEIGSSIYVIFWPHPLFKAYVESNAPVNDRQLWFLEALKQGKKLRRPVSCLAIYYRLPISLPFSSYSASKACRGVI